MNTKLWTGVSVSLAFLLGLAVMWGIHQYRDDGFLLDHAFADVDQHSLGAMESSIDDAFAEIEKMQKEMDQRFHDFGASGFGNSGFDIGDMWAPWAHLHHASPFAFRMPTGHSELKKRETDDKVIFALDVGQRDVANVDVSTADGYVTISAELTSDSGNQTSQAFVSRTRFSQKFPLPANVDPMSASVEQADDEILISFDKQVS